MEPTIDATGCEMIFRYTLGSAKKIHEVRVPGTQTGPGRYTCAMPDLPRTVRNLTIEPVFSLTDQTEFLKHVSIGSFA